MRIESKEAMRLWAQSFAESLRPGDVVSLEGDLGVGKTQVVQWIAAWFGVQEPVTSPTFALMNHYQVPGMELYHLDLYRLETEEEIEALNFEDAFYPETAITFVEWAEKAASYLPPHLLHVQIRSLGGEQREVKLWRD